MTALNSGMRQRALSTRSKSCSPSDSSIWSLRQPSSDRISEVSMVLPLGAAPTQFTGVERSCPRRGQALLSDEVLNVLVVLLADVLDQLALEECRPGGERPRLRERLRVVDDVHDFHVAEISARDALGHLHI